MLILLGILYKELSASYNKHTNIRPPVPHYDNMNQSRMGGQSMMMGNQQNLSYLGQQDQYHGNNDYNHGNNYGNQSQQGHMIRSMNDNSYGGAYNNNNNYGQAPYDDYH